MEGQTVSATVWSYFHLAKVPQKLTNAASTTQRKGSEASHESLTYFTVTLLTSYNIQNLS